MNALSVEGLSVVLGGNNILSDVSFELPRGKVVGLIGPNGAGKSTAIKTVLGLVARQAGSAKIGDRDIDAVEPRQRARQMAYVPQGAPVHWPLTAERTVALGRVPHLNPWQALGEEDEAVIRDAMEKTDCWTFRNRLVTTLSGGERAWVLLARTLAVGADFILADEPIAALDPMHQLQVMDILKAEAKGGTGVLVVMHDLGLAMRYCDSLVLLHGTQVLACGTPEDVLTDKNLKTAFGVEVSRWHDGSTNFMTPTRVVG